MTVAADPILRPAVDTPAVEASAAWREGYLAGIKEAAKIATGWPIADPFTNLPTRYLTELADRDTAIAAAILARALAKDPSDAP